MAGIKINLVVFTVILVVIGCCAQEADVLRSSDECLLEDFRCPSGSCVPKHRKCDGTPDCPDGEGEHNFTVKDFY